MGWRAILSSTNPCPDSRMHYTNLTPQASPHDAQACGNPVPVQQPPRKVTEGDGSSRKVKNASTHDMHVKSDLHQLSPPTGYTWDTLGAATLSTTLFAGV